MPVVRPNLGDSSRLTFVPGEGTEEHWHEGFRIFLAILPVDADQELRHEALRVTKEVLSVATRVLPDYALNYLKTKTFIFVNNPGDCVELDNGRFLFVGRTTTNNLRYGYVQVRCYEKVAGGDYTYLVNHIMIHELAHAWH